MTALTIKDITTAATLDAKEMTAVRGGMGFPASWGPQFSFTKNEFNFTADQQLGQSQNTLVNNGNNAAFVSGITSNVHPTQNGSNNISL
ncbi:hypothetical protein [Noviherbaspirillum galbum]|uniref:Bacteriocin n=1 Tax=Noviherbaspirillum galbum TaxID=2709383 RepID=A0A6B3SVT1_9BURK|nr:hypothetical protein [Noviherbaspirillum galbum]NEX64611.1 hypothetical protein [Noviherbaspirillum galbum]